MDKNLLDIVAKINDKNKKLFDEKAKLEKRILRIDIEIYDLSARLDDICKRLITKK